jgi:hypothetical protein
MSAARLETGRGPGSTHMDAEEEIHPHAHTPPPFLQPFHTFIRTLPHTHAHIPVVLMPARA